MTKLTGRGVSAGTAVGRAVVAVRDARNVRYRLATSGIDRERHVDAIVDDERHAGLAARGGEALDVLDDVLAGCVCGRARVGKGAALDDHVVLEVLDHQGRRLRVDLVHGLFS